MAKLITNVHAGGDWYGPDWGNAGDVPAAAAAEITNPDAWEDGKLPRAAQAAAKDAEATPVNDSVPVDGETGEPDLDALRAEYEQAVGKAPDRRWKADRLRDEITAASQGG